MTTLSQEWGVLGSLISGDEVSSPAMLSATDFAGRLHVVMQDARWGVQDVNELGNQLFRQGACDHAVVCYGLAAQEPHAYGARVNLGRCEIRLGQATAAEARARALVVEAPQLVLGWQLLSEALTAQERLPEALEVARQASDLLPENIMLARQWAILAERAQDHEAAANAFARVWQMDRSDIHSLRSLIFYRRSICLWQGLSDLHQQLLRTLEQAPAEVLPFEFLSEPATAEQQALYAGQLANWIKREVEREAIEQIKAPRLTNRLKVGFVSHGFGPHPTTILTSALFEQLRDSQLEVHLFSTRNGKDDPSCRRLATAVHTFHDVSHCSQREVAMQIQACGIEILLGLDGYCRGRRPEVFTYRPAPVQVSWLAYPGTIGGDFMDYVIADRFVLPDWLQRHFSERVAYLPRCYQCTDSRRKIGIPPTREACGLPAKGIVYACFNASYKFNPRSVMRMLRVLAAVPGSVLWLLQGSGRSAERLRDIAQSVGIAPERLVFMDKLPHRAYLARYRHVDLFLDTEYYNAHTTASDALWAGCPVLTRPGETFASRVAGSLNHHLGMLEMNMADDSAFVAQAIRYGRDAGYRKTIRAKLLRCRKESGLFDIEGFARDFEAILFRMALHHREGALPTTFRDV